MGNAVIDFAQQGQRHVNTMGLQLYSHGQVTRLDRSARCPVAHTHTHTLALKPIIAFGIEWDAHVFMKANESKYWFH